MLFLSDAEIVQQKDTLRDACAAFGIYAPISHMISDYAIDPRLREFVMHRNFWMSGSRMRNYIEPTVMMDSDDKYIIYLPNRDPYLPPAVAPVIHKTRGEFWEFLCGAPIDTGRSDNSEIRSFIQAEIVRSMDSQKFSDNRPRGALPVFASRA